MNVNIPTKNCAFNIQDGNNLVKSPANLGSSEGNITNIMFFKSPSSYQLTP